MSAYHQIFVRTDRGVEELVSDVGAAAEVQMHEIEFDSPVDYGGKRSYAAVEIELSHDFEEDYGIPFQEYPYIVTFRDFDSDKDREEAFAREVFGKLAALGKYSLMLVYNLDTLLERSAA